MSLEKNSSFDAREYPPAGMGYIPGYRVYPQEEYTYICTRYVTIVIPGIYPYIYVCNQVQIRFFFGS